LGNEAILRMVGHEAFARGVVYARTGRVREVELDLDAMTVSGSVEGTYRDAYETVVQLARGENGGSTTHRGHCTCPIALDCKHAAAVLIAARGREEVTRWLERPAWEETLSRLARAADPPPAEAIVPLGLQIDVERTPAYRGYLGRMSLRMRPVRRGKSGRWVQTGVSWDDLEYAVRSFDPAQRELLLQLRGAAGAAARYSYPRGPWIGLAAVSPGWWSLLDQTRQHDLALVTTGPGVGLRILDAEAAVVVDAHRDPSGGLRLQPEVRLEGRALKPSAYGLLGEPAHGLFAVTDSPKRPGAPGSDVALAPLVEPLSRELRQLVLDGSPVVVPAGDSQRFTEEFLPRLRSKATFVSSDASLPLDPSPAPMLTCQVHFRPEHRIRLDWGWAYQTGGGRRTFGLEEPPLWPGVRDPSAEQQVLAGLALPYERIPQLRAGSGPEPAAHALLADRHAVLFAEEVVPQLQAAGVEVTLLGEVVDYRTTDAAPLIELATADQEDSSDWFDLHIQVSVDGEKINFDELFVALTQAEEVLITEAGTCLALDRPEFASLRALINEAQTLVDDGEAAARLSISKFQAGLWEELLQLGIVIDQSAAWARTVGGLVDVQGVDQVDLPDGLVAELRPYQREGFWWLAFLYDHGLGGILADDMGLGKTVQALAMICRARQQDPHGAPFLVIAPTSVVANWAHEAARFAPGLKVVTVEASQGKRKTELAADIAAADLVVTSYTLLRIDLDAYAGHGWSGMIMDEAQFVKNHRAKSYAAARRVKAPFKLAITGTPLENSLMDLWALLSITAPGLFPHPERFSETYRRPIERGQDAELLARLRRRIRPLMLRRTKEKVASELPPKQEQVLEVVLQPKHQRIYQTHLQRERQKVLGLVDDLDKNRFTILRSLTLLRQLALDPSLVDEAYAGVPASKIEVLAEHLAELVSGGHRALVFSQFTGFLGKVKERLDADQIRYSYLDGRTKRRGQVVEGFRRGDSRVFLISLKAGGFGLNLTEADYCFVLDPWWNPASEAQAVDRTHRIGQNKTVMVYRLVAADTIEEKVMELKARKAKLFSSVLGEDALADAALTADEIKALLAP
jgi:superfamily II DNA or RNA helicase